MSTQADNALSLEFMAMADQVAKSDLDRFIKEIEARTAYRDFENGVKEHPEWADADLVGSILEKGITSRNPDFRMSSWMLLKHIVVDGNSYVPEAVLFTRVVKALGTIESSGGELERSFAHSILRDGAKRCPDMLDFVFNDVEKMAHDAEDPKARVSSQITLGMFVANRPDLVTEPMTRRVENTATTDKNEEVRAFAQMNLFVIYDHCPEFKPSLPKQIYNAVKYFIPTAK